MYRRIATLFLTLLSFALLSGLQGADMAAIKERMGKRLVRIDALKLDGSLGITNRAYLEVRVGKLSEEDRALVEAENTDRKALFEAIAQRAGVSASEVERQRARQLAQRSEAGVWLQDSEGRWYRKQ